jgi:Putative DNA-binding domain
MTGLAQQQQALLDALFAWPNDVATENIANYAYGTWARGLKAYQSHGHMLAERTLQAAYPVLAQLLGADSFAALARAFWHAYPPARGDLAQWGGDLAGFISASEQLREEPYLADVARVEWALHTCAGAADRAAEPATFQLLMAHDPAALRLVLAPGSAVLKSAWPVASIVTAHLLASVRTPGDGQGLRHGLSHSPTEPESGLAAAGAKLRARVAETAVVWRAGYQPQVREAVPGEAEILTALLDGRPLNDAVQRAKALDFNKWLSMAVQTGLLLAAERVEI